MRRWELWVRADGHSFFPADSEQARATAAELGEVFSWSTVAAGHNPAMRALYEHLGWGEYRPMLRPDGTSYPEDEDDAYRPA
jgi:hypothetical protein